MNEEESYPIHSLSWFSNNRSSEKNIMKYNETFEYRELVEIHIRKFESDIWKKLLWAKYTKK